MPGTTSSGRLRQKSIKAYLSLFSKRQTRGTILRTEYDERPLSSLPDLPNELLLLILEYLYFHDPLSDNARKLSLVCKRLNSVYSSLALEVVRLNGAANIRKFKHLAFESTCFSVGVIKTAVISYRAPAEIIRSVTSEQIVPMVRQFVGLTTIVLTCVAVNFELLKALGKLRYLNSLTYDTPYPYDALERVTRYGHFGAGYLVNRLHLLPENLEEVSFKLSCADIDEKAVEFLLPVLAASSGALTSLTIDLQAMLGTAGLGLFYHLDFPSLSTMVIYYANPNDWEGLCHFYSVHTPQLDNAKILVYIDSSVNLDSAWMDEIPGFEGFDDQNYVRRAALLMKFDGESQKDDEIPGIIIEMEELALENCTWAMLKAVGQFHPAIRVLNVWDPHEPGSSSSDSEDEFRLPIQNLKLAAPHFLNLEILRFNGSHHGLPLEFLSKPFLFCHNCGSSIHDDDGCLEFLFQEDFDYSSHEVQEWEETEWPIYRQTISELVSYLPKLRLVEWFLAPFKCSHMEGVFSPFWSWKIQRSEQSRRWPIIFGSLHDATIRPLDPIPDWNLMRGFSIPLDKVKCT